ncbi:unnamed protein product [Notodromas monacha]|uniref:Phosphatidylcholine transfer protein n=1 Tax=Notodromas monacha TaxID=399045 RepID=A0A7R9BBW8_9CRUS|nr:unnamed protein product [Notodromas monacha]CAG0912354.1 unnamed protein product [Notodromas monacha]
MNSTLVRKLGRLRANFPGACQRYGVVMMRLLARHCEFLATQRIRRTSQIVLLYSKIWNETAIQKMVERLRHEAGNRGKMLLLGAALLEAQYDWKREHIKKEDLEALFNEFEETRTLLDEHSCKHCGHRRVFDKHVSWATYCSCRQKMKVTKNRDSWEPFLERSDVVIWRRPVSTRNFEYRVFGRYDDVCAGSWFRINADDKKRQDWDDTCLEIRQVDIHPETNTQVLYWRSQYPFPMSNRDYVFKKNFIIDRKRRMALIFNHDTEHPGIPERKDHVRIKHYKSVIVVRPITDFHQDGMEFCISYVDDPGVELPEIFISYVTVQGFPNYVDKMRSAAKKLERAIGREVMSVENLLKYFNLRDETEDEVVIADGEAGDAGRNIKCTAGTSGRSRKHDLGTPLIRVVLESKLRDADSDIRRAIDVLRDALGLKKRAPRTEDIVFTVGPSLSHYRQSRARAADGRSGSPENGASAPARTDAESGPQLNSGVESPHGAGSSSSGWYATVWIPLSWLKRLWPLRSSSMEPDEGGSRNSSED